MVEFISCFLDSVNGILWGWFMIILLFGTHVYSTVNTGFIQRYLCRGLRLSFRRSDKNNPGSVSHFSSLMVALSATIGVGNIVGVATAISLGGPGAVFWCWITGFLGIATKYSEAVLAIKYREIKPNGATVGGPMYALLKGMKSKWLAGAFCVFTVFASFGIGNMVQANTLSDVLTHSAQIPAWITGIIISILVGLVLLGGVKSIASVCRRIVPFMAVFYIIGCISVLLANAKFIVPALSLILESAFSLKAIGGGMLGSGILVAARYGIARGLFSNESGMGSAPIVAAAAKTKIPAEQGLVSMTGTFWDTVIVCAMTGLVIVTTLVQQPQVMDGLEGLRITYKAFEVIPYGSFIIIISLVCFSFSTLIGWSYYGERCIEFLSGKHGIIPYRIIWVIFAFVGATTTLDIVWSFSDMSNALMVIPNVISLFALSKIIRDESKRNLLKNL